MEQGANPPFLCSGQGVVMTKPTPTGRPRRSRPTAAGMLGAGAGRRSRPTAAAVLAALAGAGLIAGCGGSSDAATAGSGASKSAGAGKTQLALVAYSTPKTAYDALTTAFAQTAAGQGISFSQSFGASGAQ